MATSINSIQIFRRELRVSIGNREKLSKLHSVVTESINGSYGEEKEMLLQLRQEIRDALNCRLHSPW